MSSPKYDYAFSVKIVGEKAVGKHCFILRLADALLTEENKIATHIFEINQKIIKVMMEIIEGDEEFRSISATNFQGIHGILLLYDITDQNSFKNLRNWLQQIKANQSIKVVLLGTKSDKIDDRAINEEEGKKLADEFNIGFFECSAKINTNIRESGYYLVDEILKDEEKHLKKQK